MGRGVIDITRHAVNVAISVYGDRQLMKALSNLERKMRMKFMRRALRNSAYRLRGPVARAAPQDTGALALELSRAKVRSASKKRGQIRLGFVLPTRKALGISSKAKGYYPTALEYGAVYKKGRRAGQTQPPLRFIRGTVDRETPGEVVRIKNELRQAVNLSWSKDIAKESKMLKRVAKGSWLRA